MPSSQLTEMFYKSFDASGIAQLLSRLAATSEAERREHPEFLGEGTHFQSFGFNGPGQLLPLAINVAKAAFLKRGPRAVDSWRKAVLGLKQLEDADLVPPIEVIDFSGLTAIVMPRGRPVDRKGAQSREIHDKLNMMSRSLGKAGFVLDDYPQLVETNGKLFINDWSDLQALR